VESPGVVVVDGVTVPDAVSLVVRSLFVEHAAITNRGVKRAIRFIVHLRRPAEGRATAYAHAFTHAFVMAQPQFPDRRADVGGL
jgi:hypothetical protein